MSPRICRTVFVILGFTSRTRKSTGPDVGRVSAHFDVQIASKQLIERRIVVKSTRLATYREAATVVWLLIVNDQFLGPGEVYTRPDLEEWRFSFEFEKSCCSRVNLAAAEKCLSCAACRDSGQVWPRGHCAGTLQLETDVLTHSHLSV